MIQEIFENSKPIDQWLIYLLSDDCDTDELKDLIHHATPSLMGFILELVLDDKEYNKTNNISLDDFIKSKVPFESLFNMYLDRAREKCGF